MTITLSIRVVRPVFYQWMDESTIINGTCEEIKDGTQAKLPPPAEPPGGRYFRMMSYPLLG